MRLLILGASGGVGMHLVKRARDRGHAVRGTVRPGSTHRAGPGVELLEGDVFDASFLKGALADRDAVVSALGLRRRTRNPYSAITAGTDVVERTLRALIPVMEALGPRRLSMVSAAGVRESWPNVSWVMRALFKTSSVGLGYADLHRAEAMLEASHLDWQAVRPTTLTDGDATGQVKRVHGYALSARIRRADVANFMLDELEREAFSERTPMISAT